MSCHVEILNEEGDMIIKHQKIPDVKRGCEHCYHLCRYRGTINTISCTILINMF